MYMKVEYSSQAKALPPLQRGKPSESAVLSLEAVSGPCLGTTLSKRGERLTVGRTRARDFHIKDSAVSERHAELHWEGRRWTVTDVGSSNGTVLNGRRLNEGMYFKFPACPNLVMAAV